MNTDVRRASESQVLRSAGELFAAGTGHISKYVVQIWSTLNDQWMDSAYRPVDTEAEALGLAADAPSEQFPRARVVLRTVSVSQHPITT